MPRLWVLLSLLLFQWTWKNWDCDGVHPPTSQPSKGSTLASSSNSEEDCEAKKSGSKSQVRQAEEASSTHLTWELLCFDPISRSMNLWQISVLPSPLPEHTPFPVTRWDNSWQTYGQAGKFTQTPTYWHRSSTWDTTLQYCQIRPCQCISLNGADSICLHRETLWILAARTTVSHYQLFLSISDI